MDSYFEWLKNAVKQNTSSQTMEEAVTAASIPHSIPITDIVDTHQPLEYPEYELQLIDMNDDEDVFEFNSLGDIERYLRNPQISTQEVFDLVYKILVDEDVDHEIATKLISIAFQRFFEDLNIDNFYVIDKPYQLFFAMYKYFFVTYEIPRLALAILMLYIVKHEQLRNIYLAPFKQITLNNEKNINVLLSLFRYVPVEDILDVSKDDEFHEYFEQFMKRLSTEPDVLKFFGIDKEDYELLLPYLIEDDNTINALFKHLFNSGNSEFCKYECLVLLTGTNVNVGECENG